MTFKEKQEQRFERNKDLLNILAEMVYNNPDLRFGQILFNCQFVKWDNTDDGIKIRDPFYEESYDTLMRVKDQVYGED